jgi:hypothetical protein
VDSGTAANRVASESGENNCTKPIADTSKPTKAGRPAGIGRGDIASAGPVA